MDGLAPAPEEGKPVSGADLPLPLGDFCLVERLAEGGMAEVFLARRYDDPGEVLAIKLLHPSLAERMQFVEMFASEGQVAALLHHPNIVRTYLAAQDGERCFICMEYLSGRELRELTRYLNERDQRLPVPVALWITEQILEALHHAHTALDAQGSPLDLVNRDVSPTNVMLTFTGQVKLIDFGIAQTTVGFTSQIGHIKGKIAYMSPEQVRGLPVDRRSDVFSAGIILHELLTSRRLFTGESDFSVMEAVRLALIPPPSVSNPLVEQELDRIVLRALERPVARRFAGARELGEALRRYRECRGQRYGEEELAVLMRSAFLAHFRADEARLTRVRSLALPARTASPGPDAGKATQAGWPLEQYLSRGMAAPGKLSLHSLLPVLVGLLLGLVLAAFIYYTVLGG
ncbi:MAG: serine/threonine protein kinase [Deltaproteobacteria bacterium]|nr:serine/threonine protein kinase [Deltaproteobacteria bacterium]